MANKTVLVNIHYKTLASTPATPPSGYMTIYPKTDNNWYQLSDTGVETKLTNVAGGSSAGTLDALTFAADFGAVPKRGGCFTITGSGFSGLLGILIWEQPNDEMEFRAIIATGQVVDDTTIKVYWSSTDMIGGPVNFYYVLML